MFQEVDLVVVHPLGDLKLRGVDALGLQDLVAAKRQDSNITSNLGGMLNPLMDFVPILLGHGYGYAEPLFGIATIIIGRA